MAEAVVVRSDEPPDAEAVKRVLRQRHLERATEVGLTARDVQVIPPELTVGPPVAEASTTPQPAATVEELRVDFQRQYLGLLTDPVVVKAVRRTITHVRAKNAEEAALRRAAVEMVKALATACLPAETKATSQAARITFVSKLQRPPQKEPR